MIRLIVAALLLAGCTQYVPFKDGPQTSVPVAPPTEYERKAQACERRGGQMVFLHGAFHCLAPKP